MSSTPPDAPHEAGGTTPPWDDVVAAPRVRHQAREALALMTFSAAASTAVATAVVVLSTLGR